MSGNTSGQAGDAVRWSWLRLSEDKKERDDVRLTHTAGLFASAQAARADLQRHLDAEAPRSRRFARAATVLRSAPARAQNVRALPHAWTLFEIEPGTSATARAQEVAEQRAGHLLVFSASGERTAHRRGDAPPRVLRPFHAIGLLLILGALGLEQLLSGIIRLGRQRPTCEGVEMKPGDICYSAGPGIGETPPNTPMTYAEAVSRLPHYSRASIAFGAVLLLLTLVSGFFWVRREIARRRPTAF